MKTILDRLLIGFTVLMIALPYTRAIIPGLGEVNVKSNLLLLLLCILLARVCVQIVCDKKLRSAGLLASVACLFALYFCASVLLGREAALVAQQMFEYAPFLIACMLVSVGTPIPYSVWTTCLVMGIAVSGLSAIDFFYFDTQFVPSDFSSEGDFAWGRLPWRPAANVLVALVTILFRGKWVSNARTFDLALMVLVVVGVVAAILTFQRTLLLAIIFLLVVSQIHALRTRSVGRQIGFIGIFLVVLILASAVLNFDNVIHNVEDRIVGFIDMSSDISGHTETRELLYRQYWGVISEHPVLGAGFGVPFATYPELSFYSDVTLVSFGLPFGVLGLVVFGAFIRTIWLTLDSVQQQCTVAARVGLKLAIVSGLLVSLNDDIWSHKEFVITLTMTIMSLVGTHRSVTLGSARCDC
jgi:O-Antigen ligase